jgi:hypothetical protein
MSVLYTIYMFISIILVPVFPCMATLYLSFIYPSESESKTSDFLVQTRFLSVWTGKSDGKVETETSFVAGFIFIIRRLSRLRQVSCLKRVSRLPNKHDMGNIGRLSNGR